jgi:hypothetical protein
MLVEASGSVSRNFWKLGSFWNFLELFSSLNISQHTN